MFCSRFWSSNRGRNNKNIHTSSHSGVLLQGAYIQLQGQLGGWAQESLDHRCPAERRSVGEQLALCLAHFLLNLLWVAIFWHLSLLGDADIRLFDVAWLTIDAEDFKTPRNKITSDNQRHMGFCLFSVTLLILSLILKALIWLLWTAALPLKSSTPRTSSKHAVLLRPSSRPTGSECEPVERWYWSPLRQGSKVENKKWFRLQSHRKNVQFTFLTLISCAALGKSFNPWTLNYKAEIILLCCVVVEIIQYVCLYVCMYTRTYIHTHRGIDISLHLCIFSHIQ